MWGVMAIVKWNPFRELHDMQLRLDRVFGEAPFGREAEEGSFLTDWAPAVDVQETEKEYLVKADLPEMKKEDVKVGLRDGVLTIEGERKREKEEKDKKYHRIELTYGSFIRNFTLPEGTSSDKINAEFKDGVLKLHLPKDEKAKPKTVDVKIG